MDESWIDRGEYPFRSRSFPTQDGRLHYVDEGEGPPVVLVHGTPTWSFLWRHLIRGLSGSHRVVAVDHLGFGLSDKPEGAPYRPADHARRLAALLDHLDLRDVALGVHDFGGPIGLSYAIERPERVSRLILLNTWMWSLADVPAARTARSLARSALGRLLYRRLNVSPRVLMKAVMGDRRKLTPAIHRHYVKAFPGPRERVAPWVLAGELAGSSEWYDSLWRRREALVGKPALLLWGMKDPTFTPDYLRRWLGVLESPTVVELPEAGHFVQEEEGERLVPVIEGFLRTSPGG